MQKSNAPAIITVPFASGAGAGYIRTVPIPSQIPITPGAASWTDGFPPLTMTPSGAGGIPPYGQDMNGVLYAETTNMQWKQLGFDYPWSSSVSTAIGGYPAGAKLLRADGLGHWLNLADNNTTNPDATGATGWVAQRTNAGQSTIVVSSGTVTPDPSVLGVPLLVLSGTLTANVTLVLPLTRAGAAWRIYNATTGAFTVNVQGATGSGVTAAQAQLTDVTTDGTNFYSVGISGGPFLPLHGTADAAVKLAVARNIAMTGDVTWNVNFDGSGNVTAAGTIQAAAVTLAKMANFTANSLMGNPTGSAATPSAITLGAGLQFSSSQLQLVPTSAQVVGWLGYSPVQSFNSRTGAIVLSSSDVTTALGYAPVNKAGDTMSGALNITTAGTNGLNISSSSTNSASLQLINTASGGRTYTVGAFNATSSGVTGYGVYDGTASKFAMYIDANNQLINNGKIRAITSSGPAYDANIADNNWALIINDVSDLNTRGGVWRSSSTPGVALINVLAGFKGIWAYDNGTFATDGAFTVNGAFTCTGVASLNTSDKTLKDSIQVIDARPLHRNVDFTSYRRLDLDLWGKGLLAQDLIAQEPLYGGSYEHTFENGEKAIKLGINEAKAALEEAWWCGHQIDRIILALQARGIEVQ